jgi:hypothetical protein
MRTKLLDAGGTSDGADDDDDEKEEEEKEEEEEEEEEEGADLAIASASDSRLTNSGFTLVPAGILYDAADAVTSTTSLAAEVSECDVRKVLNFASSSFDIATFAATMSMVACVGAGALKNAEMELCTFAPACAADPVGDAFGAFGALGTFAACA